MTIPISFLSIKSCLLVLLCFAIIGNAKAAQKNAALLSQKTSITIKNNKLSRHSSYEICIYNREGEKYTDIEIPFSKMNKVSDIDAHIKTIDGKIIKKLSKNDISERNSYPSYSFYEDQFVKEFTLKHNQYPYIICYEFEEKEDEFIYVDNWYPILDFDIPTLEASLTIQAPKDYKINFHSQLVSKFAKDTLEDNFIYQWEATYDGHLKNEAFTPPLYDFLPLVTVVPEDFKFDIEGSFASWQSYGLWQHKLIKDISDLPDLEINKTKKLTEGMEDKKQIVKTLFHYLQDETRYINISIETGGLKPYPASYVAQNRYGDCKALSNYFRAILKSQNIESFYSKIFAGGTIASINHTLPSQQSNHVIICVPVDNRDTLWIDCTSDDPFNYVGTFIQNREVFVINEDKSFFSRTPILQPNQVLLERNVSMKYELNNETLADFTNTYRGKQFEILDQIDNSFKENKKVEIIRDNILENKFEPISINFSPQERDSTKITLKYSARSSEVFKEYGNDLILKILPFSLPKIETPVERKLPFQIDYPIYQKDTLHYKITDEYEINSSLPNTLLTSAYGNYSISAELRDKELIIIKSFLLNNGYYQIEEYNDLYEFLQTVINLENKTYITTSKKS
ncbi:DUF3857 and transglutaminase domain-containing protein [Maribellus sp. CM-23]|uniref:DUF3857 domain-containing protein n=1 Tax=Maribellus sp. CM-23 TaxID=2781026 RepID=UPI001F17C7CE|nr:DUF3857 domain-containing protein [Maribellus sp. CM-23]MCE4565784.1 DUF3857 and transglutaminase domain-containing protein [Maribellus sp. CM-23]